MFAVFEGSSLVSGLGRAEQVYYTLVIFPSHPPSQIIQDSDGKLLSCTEPELWKPTSARKLRLTRVALPNSAGISDPNFSSEFLGLMIILIISSGPNFLMRHGSPGIFGRLNIFLAVDMIFRT